MNYRPTAREWLWLVVCCAALAIVRVLVRDPSWRDFWQVAFGVYFVMVAVRVSFWALRTLLAKSR
jgi:hypothetical protein